jgi:CheY-like chemotaxis protein
LVTALQGGTLEAIAFRSSSMGSPYESASYTQRDERGIRVLVADDDPSVRSLLATLLRDAKGVSSVLEAGDGAQAAEVVRKVPVHVAVLDLNMPRVDGVEAARLLLTLQPSMRVALHSSDPDALRARAHSTGLPLFDKRDFDSLFSWIERQAASQAASAGTSTRRKLELSCSRCGYGIVAQVPPTHCPMCQAAMAWAEPDPARDAAARAHADEKRGKRDAGRDTDEVWAR